MKNLSRDLRELVLASIGAMVALAIYSASQRYFASKPLCALLGIVVVVLSYSIFVWAMGAIFGHKSKVR
jgi:hypothetical protein